MKENPIRLQYSGFIIFAAKMFSVATGVAFQYMIARYTTTGEYGIWFNINDVLAYFTITAGIMPFWVLRFVARSEKGAVKTGVVANFAISLAATFVYLPLIPLIVSALGAQQYISLYLLASFQIVELHMLGVFEACLRAKKPQTLGYGLVIAEVSKVLFGYILIVGLQKPLEGAVIGLTAGIAAQLLYYLKLLAEDLKQKIEWAYVREWLKGSIANVYNLLGNQIAAFIFILLFTYGGKAARGFYGAASLIANIISYSTVLAFALYPKLLAERKSEDITTSLKTVLMFAIPMTAGALAAPDLYLSILEREYARAWYVLGVLAVDALVATISTVFGFVLYGFERVDEKARISFKELFKSRMFLSFSLPYIHSAVTIPLTYFVLSTYTQNQPELSAFSVAIINSAMRFAMFMILYLMVRGMVKVVIPWRNIAKYVFASVIMGCLLCWLRLQLQLARVYQILGVSAFAGILYLALLMVIDKDTRMLAESAWLEIKTKFEYG
ncbi:MAG: hypothetical protein NZ932_05710 [Candidatus Bathyarchaeota archaeon]|nr:hypothetical protein [Candidatus Bathyarchaeota archaeon]MDW8040698.1 hypothetical protein [Nitrososphaerota archaeon]